MKPLITFSYHGGVAAADELPDLVKDALTVNTFVHGAPLDDDGDSQQDLLANVLLEAGENEQNQHLDNLEEEQPRGREPNAGEEKEQKGGVEMCCTDSRCCLLSLARLARKR